MGEVGQAQGSGGGQAADAVGLPGNKRRARKAQRARGGRDSRAGRGRRTEDVRAELGNSTTELARLEQEDGFAFKGGLHYKT